MRGVRTVAGALARRVARGVAREVVVGVALGLVGGRAGAQGRGAVASAPALLVWRGHALAEARVRLGRGDPQLRPAYDTLIAAAGRALTVGPFAVTDKVHRAPSGDPHDYMSTGPYWWPDPARPGGLPYVRRDGVVNVAGRRDSDALRFLALTDAVETLALAHYVTGDERYAARAALLVRTWFLDPATRMNPNLRYAQAIPGVTSGRGIGIIDLRDLPLLLDATVLLRGSPSWSEADRAGLQAWCRRYAEWLATSRNARDERHARNNHGTWYDEQDAGVALFLGDTARARAILRTRVPRRMAAQIRPDGSLPLEGARTRPLHYTIFDIEPFERLAELGRHVGVDLWHARAPGGGSLRRAVLFIAPYADPAVHWPKPDVTPVAPAEFVLPLRRAATVYGGLRLAAALARLPGRIAATDRSRLLYPDTGASRRRLDTLAARALDRAADQLRRSADSLDPGRGYPRSTGVDGRWTLTRPTAWTSGFFPGLLWLMYAHSGRPSWRARAARWTAPLAGVRHLTTTHDLGFILFDSFGLGYRLTGDPAYRDVVLAGSRTLARRFNSVVGAIKSWDTQGVHDRRRGWAYPVIIDNMMNLEMLFWSAAHGGDPAWRAIAERHAFTSLAAHLRPDGSTAHVALFDPVTGRLLRRVTWQGASDTSAWARGQAWAIYGFAAAYRATGRRAFLAGAQRAADYFITHLPADGAPYWDFRAPAIPRAPRDASAAAVAASGLLLLAEGSGEGAAASRDREAAVRILTALCTRYESRPGSRSAAILLHGVGGYPQGSEIDVGLIYADYYFVEAVLRYEQWRRGEPGVLGGR